MMQLGVTVSAYQLATVILVWLPCWRGNQYCAGLGMEQSQRSVDMKGEKTER